jgi:hypothetical protein
MCKGSATVDYADIRPVEERPVHGVSGRAEGAMRISPAKMTAEHVFTDGNASAAGE